MVVCSAVILLMDFTVVEMLTSIMALKISHWPGSNGVHPIVQREMAQIIPSIRAHSIAFGNRRAAEWVEVSRYSCHSKFKGGLPPPRVVGRSGYGACSLHCAYALNMS